MTQPTWDVSLQRQLVHQGSRFTLDVRFATAQPHLALVGPSGAGKSQTLKMIAGIARPDAGRVQVAGRLLHDSASGFSLPAQRRRLGYVFQDYALFPHLTVRQNIGFARRGGWLNPQRAWPDDTVQRWLRAFHLTAIADHQPHQISGGQRQRTALARALAAEPAALLLDEPFAALDKPLRAHLRRELRDLRADIDIPTLLITHDDEDAALLAGEVLHMQAGRLVPAAQAAQAVWAEVAR
ncbi:MAG: ATP-binding cassette domain-containing protein [Aquincola tertiaricarbonis]|uniref:ATP-binding cassette domain-containing protein n=1 Tax=Aquincola tertiaricarbonis TaxID=391953 RepID=UPI00061505DA|nr:ATP-binding cassette domain-containing protein [Aquincola tertiaricarbonis]